jgi:dipeptidyl aminopeptidase/acylaminoacyl peptidase
MRRLSALCALLLTFCGSMANARPYTVEDLLSTEAFGRVVFDPTERWAIIEHRRPWRTAARFDYNQQTPLLLTELLRVDLKAPGPAVSLFPQQADAGFLAGPIAPDGQRMLVYRLRGHSFEAGLATLATRSVRWLGVTPELANHGPVAAWRSTTELLLIARPTGDLPRQLAIGWEANGRRAALDAATASGRTEAVTTIGSGRFLGVRPRDKPGRLLRIDAQNTRISTLATGEFVDLAISASGRYAALIAEGADLQPRAADRLYTAFPTRHRSLTLLDLRDGQVTSPCPGCAISLGVLSWSPTEDELLVATSGPDGDGRALMQVDATTGTNRPLLPAGLALQVDETAWERTPRPRVDWMGEDPIVWARPAGGRTDWYRLNSTGPINLTAGLAAPTRNLGAVGPDHLLVPADGGIWRIDREGQHQRPTTGAGHLALVSPEPEPGSRLASNPQLPRDWIATIGQTGLTWWNDPSPTLPVAIPPGAQPLAVSRRHLALLVRGEGGVRRLVLVSATGAATTVLGINPGMADVTPARVVAIHHRGLKEEPLTSWLYLPPKPSANRLPLVVIPYRGRVFPSPLAQYEVGGLSPHMNPQLLAAQGYAVLTPSLPYDATVIEPTAGVADQILSVVDAAIATGVVDPDRIALWGHSFGGLIAIAAAEQSPRFKSVIAAAGVQDLVSRWGAFSSHRWVIAEDGYGSATTAGMVEQGQFSMGAPPWADPQRYLRNSNIFAADRITAPVLLIHGETDEENIAQSQELFSALYRQGKDAQMVTYWGEGHVLSSPANIADFYQRIFDWLALTLPALDHPELAPTGVALAPTSPIARAPRPSGSP